MHIFPSVLPVSNMFNFRLFICFMFSFFFLSLDRSLRDYRRLSSTRAFFGPACATPDALQVTFAYNIDKSPNSRDERHAPRASRVDAAHEDSSSSNASAEEPDDTPRFGTIL